MTKTLVTTAAVIAAILVVLTERLLIPALVLCFNAIAEAFTPDEEGSAPVLVAVPATPPAPKKARSARRRKPSKALLAKVEAIS